MELTLEADSTDTIIWLIRTAYDVHPDLKCCSKGMMSLGKGAAARKLRRHRINPRNSPESDIIGFYNHVPGVL